jgi:hypothetical protein
MQTIKLIEPTICDIKVDLPPQNKNKIQIMYFCSVFFTTFSPQFHSIQLVVTVLSHRCNSRTKRQRFESCASPETQPNQAALLLDTIPA